MDNICGRCWKSYIWACPLLTHFPINIRTCTAYEPTDVHLKEQELVLKFLNDLRELVYREWDETLPSGNKIHHIRILNYKYKELIKKYKAMIIV